MKKTNLFLCACGVIAATVAAMSGCAEGAADSYSNADSSSGKGGSMARFTISGDWLYTVNDQQLTVVSLADPARPVEGEKFNIGSGVETIFTMDTLLFVGSQSAMYIYDIRKAEYPKKLSRSLHFKSCDPVVAIDTLAFVTLNSSLGGWCGQSGNQMNVYDISDVKNPVSLCTVEMSSPRGLAVDGEQKIVFVCDNGIKAYDITDPRNVEILYTSISVPEVGRPDAYDCLLWQNRLLVTGADGLYQLGYDREKFTFISKIDIRREQ